MKSRLTIFGSIGNQSFSSLQPKSCIFDIFRLLRLFLVESNSQEKLTTEAAQKVFLLQRSYCSAEHLFQNLQGYAVDSCLKSQLSFEKRQIYLTFSSNSVSGKVRENVICFDCIFEMIFNFSGIFLYKIENIFVLSSYKEKY